MSHHKGVKKEETQTCSTRLGPQFFFYFIKRGRLHKGALSVARSYSNMASAQWWASLATMVWSRRADAVGPVRARRVVITAQRHTARPRARPDSRHWSPKRHHARKRNHNRKRVDGLNSPGLSRVSFEGGAETLVVPFPTPFFLREAFWVAFVWWASRLVFSYYHWKKKGTPRMGRCRFFPDARRPPLKGTSKNQAHYTAQKRARPQTPRRRPPL